ncbi:TssQ family T6SS-associated lipoprotein [Burkholderia sp. 4701]|nr:TssQ family T6SS-associated lipoprotein [Burkholderia sp. 4701]MXN85528.1 TssQ family T6SS-associated lipoprotein [Burkholderia sp. 4812]
MKGRSSLVVFLGVLWLALGGCGTSAPPAQPAARAALDSARAAYDTGDYARTIAILNRAHDIDAADTDTQVAAHKLLAFSYCVTNRIATCRAEFAKILALNPRFDLSPAEKGHPIWGPAFEAARRKHASSS